MAINSSRKCSAYIHTNVGAKKPQLNCEKGCVEILQSFLNCIDNLSAYSFSCLQSNEGLNGHNEVA